MIPRKKIAIVGSGPAGLMAATRLASIAEVTLFEKRPGLGRKLLIAGSSGLNISHHYRDVAAFARHYDAPDFEFWHSLLTSFGPEQWLQFIEKELKLETFLGTSDRYFVREMKAANLLKRWMEWLKERGVCIRTECELTDFSESASGVDLSFREVRENFDFAIFALGGGSWEEVPPSWIQVFRSKGIAFQDFEPSNVGYEVEWSPSFLAEAEGKPLKKITLTTPRGTKGGELVITRYGLEGTPVYFTGCIGEALLDLKPDLSEDEVLARLKAGKENLSPIRRVKKNLNLCEASQALVFHHTSGEVKNDIQALARQIKNFPVRLLRPRPLMEAISSRGGVKWSELTKTLQLKKYPHIFCCGEMIDWDSPTGGFLIQGCVSMGAWVAGAIRSI